MTPPYREDVKQKGSHPQSIAESCKWMKELVCIFAFGKNRCFAGSSPGDHPATYTHATNKVQEQAAAKMGNLLKQAL